MPEIPKWKRGEDVGQYCQHSSFHFLRFPNSVLFLSFRAEVFTTLLSAALRLRLEATARGLNSKASAIQDLRSFLDFVASGVTNTKPRIGRPVKSIGMQPLRPSAASYSSGSMRAI